MRLAHTATSVPFLISTFFSSVLALPSYNEISLLRREPLLSVSTGPGRSTQNYPSNAERPFKTSRSSINNYEELAYYCQAAYCGNTPGGVGSDGQVLWKYGNGDDYQQVFIAHSPSMGLIVSFEGTKSSSLTSVLNDLMIGLAQPMQGLQWLPQGTRLSQGFQNSWSISAQPLLRELRSLLKRYDNPTVWITGHSLGGATALISALHHNHYLDADIKLVTFGMPRVGNKMFADAVDHYLPYHKRIVHNNDVIPHLPGNYAGYQHPEGEVWMANEQASRILDCPGQENPFCSYSVPTTAFSLSDHQDYFGMPISTCPTSNRYY